MNSVVLQPNNVFDEFKRRATRIRETSGISGVIRGALLFLIYPFYKRTNYYLYENNVRPEYREDERRPRVDSSRLKCFIVKSNEEAEKLEAEGFSFRKYPTPFNNYLKTYTSWLDLGTIACCTFVDGEFAATNWIIPSKKVQEAIKAAPVRIDFDNHQVLTRGIWVNPKFRGMELYRYTIRNRDRYLADKGIRISRGPVEVSNKVGKGTVESMGSHRYGVARSQRILWIKSWKEFYI